MSGEPEKYFSQTDVLLRVTCPAGADRSRSPDTGPAVSEAQPRHLLRHRGPWRLPGVLSPDPGDVPPGLVIVVLPGQAVEVSCPDLASLLCEHVLQTLLNVFDLLHPVGLHPVVEVESSEVERLHGGVQSQLDSEATGPATFDLVLDLLHLVVGEYRHSAVFVKLVLVLEVGLQLVQQWVVLSCRQSTSGFIWARSFMMSW